MKTAIVLTISIVLGGLLGMGLTALDLRRIATYVKPGANSEVDDAVESMEFIPVGEPQPKVTVVGETFFDFGDMEFATEQSHSFIFRNDGDGPMRLVIASTTCRCTAGEVPGGDILPGESVPVTLTWSPREGDKEFRQTAHIVTNDRERSQIELTIRGKITQMVQLDPRDMVISQIAPGETREADARIWLFNDHAPEITGHRYADPATVEFFDLRVENVGESDLLSREAKSGRRIIVRVLPGLPVGAFSQTLILETNIPQHEKMTIPIQGNVTTGVTVIGANIGQTGPILDLGTINGAEGLRREIPIRIRPPQGMENVELEIEQVSPEVLKASLGESSNNRLFPLIVEIPPGASTQSHLESIGGYGEIVLKTNLPLEPRVRVKVSFIVE